MTDDAPMHDDGLTAQQLELLLPYAAFAVVNLGSHHNALLERLQRALDKAKLLSPRQRAEAILQATSRVSAPSGQHTAQYQR